MERHTSIQTQHRQNVKKDHCTVLPGEWNVRDAIPETERYTEIRMMEQG